MEFEGLEKSLVFPLNLSGCGVSTAGDLAHLAYPNRGPTDQAGDLRHPPDSV